MFSLNLISDPRACAVQSIAQFFNRQTSVPRCVLFQNATNTHLAKFEQLYPQLAQRTQCVNGTVTYYRSSSSMNEESGHFPNINDRTVYLGLENTLIVNTCLAAPHQLMELLDSLYGEERVVIIIGDFNHNISEEEYKYVHEIDVGLTSNRSKTGGVLILMNDAGLRFIDAFLVLTPTKLLDGTLLNRSTPIPCPAHPLAHALIEVVLYARPA